VIEKDLDFVGSVLKQCYELFDRFLAVAQGERDVDALRLMTGKLEEAIQVVETELGLQMNQLGKEGYPVAIWLPGDIARLNWVYGSQVLNDASPEAYGKANEVIGLAAGVPASKVEEWITGGAEPTAKQSVQLISWLTFWTLAVREDGGNDPGVAEALAKSMGAL